MSTQARLRDVLLDTSDDEEVTLQQLTGILEKRMVEGNGETLFDLGQEDHGESMRFSKEQWDVALDRLIRAAKFLRAECSIQMTRNVGGDLEVGPTNEKDKSCTGKVMIRQTPETPEDVIETRIAVVGNGEAHTRRVLHRKTLEHVRVLGSFPSACTSLWDILIQVFNFSMDPLLRMW